MVGVGRDERAQVGGIKVGAGRNVRHDEPDDPAVPAHDERHAGLVLAEAHRAQRRQLDVGEDEPAMAGPGRSVASPGHPCGRGAGHRAAPQAVVARSGSSHTSTARRASRDNRSWDRWSLAAENSFHRTDATALRQAAGDRHSHPARR